MMIQIGMTMYVSGKLSQSLLWIRRLDHCQVPFPPYQLLEDDGLGGCDLQRKTWEVRLKNVPTHLDIKPLTLHFF